jgi:hypothetical protein
MWNLKHHQEDKPIKIDCGEHWRYLRGLALIDDVQLVLQVLQL